MDMGIINGYIKILQGFTEGQDALQINTEFIDKLARRSPAFRMFLDSPFNSETEIAIKKFFVDSHISSIRDKLPEGKISNSIAIFLGKRLGNAQNATLDRCKAFYKYNKGQITLDEYQDIRATQIQASIVNIYKKTKWITRKAIATLCGFDDNSSTESKIGFGYLIRKGEKLIEKALASEPTKKLIKASVATIHAGVAVVKKTYNTVKECVVDPVIKTVSNAINKGAEVLVDITDKTVKTVSKVYKKTKVFIKGIFKKK